MTPNEYITGFFGIVFGLAITEILRGVYKTLIDSSKVIYFTPHAIALCSLFVITLNFFFDYFRILKLIDSWSPLVLILHVTPLISVFFITMVIFPAFKGDQIDFKEHTFKILPKIYVAGILVGSYLIIRNMTLFSSDPFSAEHNKLLYLQLPFYFLFLIFRKKTWAYWVVTVSTLIANLWLANIFVIH